MDIFRHKKKKQAAAAQQDNAVAVKETAVAVTAAADLGQVVSTTTDEKATGAAAVDSDETTGIDALIDSDEDGAEIFDDCESDDDDDVATPSSKRSTLSKTEQFKDVLTMLVTDATGDDARDDGDSSQNSEDEKSASDSAEDYTDDEDEGEDGYKPGGYHPVKVGEVYNQRYGRITYLFACNALSTFFSNNIFSLQICHYQKAGMGPLFHSLDGQGSKATAQRRRLLLLCAQGPKIR